MVAFCLEVMYGTLAHDITNLDCLPEFLDENEAKEVIPSVDIRLSFKTKLKEHPSDELAPIMDNIKKLEGIRVIFRKTLDELDQQIDVYISAIRKEKDVVVSNKRKHSLDNITTGSNQGPRTNTDDLRNRPGTSKDNIDNTTLSDSTPSGQISMFLQIVNGAPKALPLITIKNLEKNKRYKITSLTKTTITNNKGGSISNTDKIKITLDNAKNTYLLSNQSKAIIENNLLSELQNLAKKDMLFTTFTEEGQALFQNQN